MVTGCTGLLVLAGALLIGASPVAAASSGQGVFNTKVAKAAGEPLARKLGSPIPLSAYGCSSSVCINIVGPSGYSALYYADITDVGESCLPDFTEINLLYGSSPSSASIFRSGNLGVVPAGWCYYGYHFPLGQNFNNKWWFCGTISVLPGKPCEQVSGPPYYP